MKENNMYSPNDPKLSDSRAGHDPCSTPRADGSHTKLETTRGAESTGHDAPGCSLQRMVRRLRSDSGEIGSVIIGDSALMHSTPDKMLKMAEFLLK